MARICVFGDSIVWGAEDLINGGWVDRFKIYFKKTGKFNEVFNLGNANEDSTLLLKRIENECKVRIKPKYKESGTVIIQIGLNDSQFLYDKQKTRTSLKQFKRNLKKLINLAQKLSSKVILIGLLPVNELKTAPIFWNKNRFYKNKNIQKYNQIIKSVCEESDVYFIEIFEEWIKMNYKKLLEDGVHPNSEGHQKIFEIVKDFLEEKKVIE